MKDQGERGHRDVVQCSWLKPSSEELWTNSDENHNTAILKRMLSSRCKMLTQFAVKDVDVVLFSVAIELAFVCLRGNSSWNRPWTVT